MTVVSPDDGNWRARIRPGSLGQAMFLLMDARNIYRSKVGEDFADVAEADQAMRDSIAGATGMPGPCRCAPDQDAEQ